MGERSLYSQLSVAEKEVLVVVVHGQAEEAVVLIPLLLQDLDKDLRDGGHGHLLDHGALLLDLLGLSYLWGHEVEVRRREGQHVDL